MVYPRREELRRALVARVRLKVAGLAISRRTMDDVVGRMVGAVAAAAPTVTETPDERETSAVPQIAALAARSAPGLVSRVRDALAAEGLGDVHLGSASSGQHTIVTLCVPAGMAGAVERAAGRLGVQVSIVGTAGAHTIG